MPRTIDGNPPPPPGAAPKLLIRFAHLADTQLHRKELMARWLIRAIPVDYSVEGDPLLPEARRRAAADHTAGWIGEVAGPGPDDARAIELTIPKAP